MSVNSRDAHDQYALWTLFKPLRRFDGCYNTVVMCIMIWSFVTSSLFIEECREIAECVSLTSVSSACLLNNKFICRMLDLNKITAAYRKSQCEGFSRLPALWILTRSRCKGHSDILKVVTNVAMLSGCYNKLCKNLVSSKLRLMVSLISAWCESMLYHFYVVERHRFYW